MLIFHFTFKIFFYTKVNYFSKKKIPTETNVRVIWKRFFFMKCFFFKISVIKAPIVNFMIKMMNRDECQIQIEKRKKNENIVLNQDMCWVLIKKITLYFNYKSLIFLFCLFLGCFQRILLLLAWRWWWWWWRTE